MVYKSMAYRQHGGDAWGMLPYCVPLARSSTAGKCLAKQWLALLHIGGPGVAYVKCATTAVRAYVL
jgi:hypothetical protein